MRLEELGEIGEVELIIRDKQYSTTAVIDGEFVNRYELFMCCLFYKLYGHAMIHYIDLPRIYWSYENGRIPIDSLWKLDKIT